MAATEPSAGIEPATPSLPWKCSTTELRGLVCSFTRTDTHTTRWKRGARVKITLCFTAKAERETGVEPATLSLEG